LAPTDAFPRTVSEQVLALFPPLERAPDQLAARPFVTLRTMSVPVANNAEPLLPTLTLIPAGLQVALSPVRPVAVTVNEAVVPCCVTVRVVERCSASLIANIGVSKSALIRRSD
jgi:hypothetical protein